MARMPEPVGPDIVEFAMSPKYLGKSYLSVAQVAVLKAIYGLEMSREERLAFLEMSEGREPKRGGYTEAAIIAGVRSGKSDLFGGVITTYECVRWGPYIGPLMTAGQVAKGIVIAENQKQAGEVRGYIEGNLLALEDRGFRVLADTEGQEKAITGAAIRLRWPVEITVYPANRVGVRGATGLCAVMDEIAYWQCGEGAYNQDRKIVHAVRTRFATLSPIRPKRIMISSPDEESGVLYDEWVKREASKALVLKCPTWMLNPSVTQEFLDAEQEKYPEDFATEYGAEFRRTGGEHCFLANDIVDKCIDRGRTVLNHKPGYEYLAWMDAGFKHDPFAVGIGHLERGSDMATAYIDMVYRWVPPKGRGRYLDPEVIIPEVVEILKAYWVDKIFGDQFADVPMKGMFRNRGITFIEVPTTNTEKNEAYKNLRGGLRGGQVSLPDDPILSLELKSLVKKETAGGQMHIAVPKSRKNLHDDLATVVSRIVGRLLPMMHAVDIEALNAKAMPVRRHDWRTDDDRRREEISGAFGTVGSIDGESPFVSIESVVM